MGCNPSGNGKDKCVRNSFDLSYRQLSLHSCLQSVRTQHTRRKLLPLPSMTQMPTMTPLIFSLSKASDNIAEVLSLVTRHLLMTQFGNQIPPLRVLMQ